MDSYLEGSLAGRPSVVETHLTQHINACAELPRPVRRRTIPPAAPPISRLLTGAFCPMPYQAPRGLVFERTAES